MNKVAIVFWSSTGNTQQMAELIESGAKEAGAQVNVFAPNEFSAEKIDEFDTIAFGCPSMGAEQLEEDEFEPMFLDVKEKLNGKKIALFGSYGWGDGEWMRTWEEDCSSVGAILISESVICNESPDDEAISKCRELGKKLA